MLPGCYMTNPQPTTSDPAEIQRFNQLAATWWNPDGPMWPLHLLNRFRLELILNVLHDQGTIDRYQPKPLAGKSVLDIGCGGGILSEALCRLGAQVTATDTAANSIKIAKQHATGAKLDIHYHCTDIASLSEQFDLVFNLEVVEHVTDLRAFMSASCERVADGGSLFLSTINKSLKSYLFAIIGAEYVLRLLPKGTHRWSKFVTPNIMQNILSEQGLEVFWRSGVSLNPFNKQYKLVQSEAVNYMMAANKPRDLSQ